MKLVFISDIHGSKSALEKTLAGISEEKWDRIIILGDALYHGPRNPLPDDYSPAEVASILNTIQGSITAVRGNCDAEVDQMLIDYPMMEDYAILVDSERKFFLTHGHIYNPEILPVLSKGDVFAFGHTHVPVAEKKDGLYFFNPGSISIPKGGFPASYGIFRDSKLSVVSLEGETLMECGI